MCVIAAKYFDGIGWVGVKNRDRNYKPELEFRQSFRDGIERLYLVDLLTKYSEGLNEHGICIMNAATAVKRDESEAAVLRKQRKEEMKRNRTYSAPDGVMVRNALKLSDIEEVVKYLYENEFQGNTLVFNQERCFLLECGPDKDQLEAEQKKTEEDPDYEWQEIDKVHKYKEIKKEDIILRTNHGHFLPWAGYDKNSRDEKMLFSRKSSEMRYDYARKNIKKATTPEELLEAVSKIEDEDSQMNPLRLGDYNNRARLKTTGQLMFIPKNCEFVYRPIWGNVDLNNINKLNSQKSKTFLSVKAFNSSKINESILFEQWIENANKLIV
jgi:hypothetical protein